MLGAQSCQDSFATLWTVACQSPLSMGFSRQGHWSELPFLPPGDLPDPGMEPASPALAGGFFTPSHLGSPISPLVLNIKCNLTKIVYYFKTIEKPFYSKPLFSVFKFPNWGPQLILTHKCFQLGPSKGVLEIRQFCKKKKKRKVYINIYIISVF